MREVASIDRPNDCLAIDDLGLTLAEAKAMLAALQAAIATLRCWSTFVASGRACAAVEPGG